MSAGSLPLIQGQLMKKFPLSHLPPSLSIALWLVAAWLVAALWLVAIAAYALNAPAEIVHAAFVVGLLCGVVEWFAIRGHRR